MVQAEHWNAQHVVCLIYEDCGTTIERGRRKQPWWSQDHFLIVTVQPLKYDLRILAPTVPPSGSLSTSSSPVSSDVGTGKHVSAAGSDFRPRDPGIWRGGGSTSSPSSRLPSQHILNKQARAPAQASTHSISRTWGRNIPPSRKRGVTSTGVLGIEEG